MWEHFNKSSPTPNKKSCMKPWGIALIRAYYLSPFVTAYITSYYCLIEEQSCPKKLTTMTVLYTASTWITCLLTSVNDLTNSKAACGLWEAMPMCSWFWRCFSLIWAQCSREIIILALAKDYFCKKEQLSFVK